MKSRSIGSLLTCVTLFTFLGCCCGAGNKEAKARAKAEEIFAAIRADDMEGLRSHGSSWLIDNYSAKRLGKLVDASPELAGHTWVGLTNPFCSDWTCEFDCTFDPGAVPGEINLTLTGDGWVLDEIEVRGEQIIP